jgi:N-acetylmuramoyl-L-alanine amidase
VSMPHKPTSPIAVISLDRVRMRSVALGLAMGATALWVGAQVPGPAVATPPVLTPPPSLAAPTPPPVDGVTVTRLQPQSLATETRVTLQFDKAPRVNVVDALKERGYVYVDIYGMDTTYRRRLLPMNDGRVRAIDAITYAEYNVLRLVIYASTPTLRYRVVPVPQPPGLVISVWDERVSGVTGNMTQQEALEATAPGQAQLTPRPGGPSEVPEIPEPSGHVPKLRSGAVKTVIIDPGHGGGDKGARSRVELQGEIINEKDLTLQFAYHLKKLLDQSPNIVSLVSRTDDRQVSLYDRVKFAEANDGDLFISIHMNDGASNPAARGMEVYYLNDRGTVTGAAKAVEERENRDFGEDANPFAAGTLVRAILTDMERRKLADFRYESYNFCRAVEASLIQMPYYRAHNRGVKSANFVVLRNFKMPAILLEVGFISNSEELRYLTNPEFQQATAVSLFNSINAYFAETDPSFQPNSIALPRMDSGR